MIFAYLEKLYKRIMKKSFLLILIMYACNTSIRKPTEPIHLDELDKAARDLKEQLLLNYQKSIKKPLAIASFVRNDIDKFQTKYYSVTPKLGIYLANALQNEMFQPQIFDLVERQRIDSILDEISYGKIGLADENTLESIKLSGAELLVLGIIQKRNNSIRFDARIVNIADGKILSVATSVIAVTPYILKLYDDYPNNKKEYTGVIQARKEWQLLNTYIEPNSLVILEAEGDWSMTNNRHSFGALGQKENPSEWGDYRLYDSLNHGQLICRINTKQDFFFSLGEYQFTLGGYPECRINDTDLDNNTGSLKVTIYHYSISK